MIKCFPSLPRAAPGRCRARDGPHPQTEGPEEERHQGKGRGSWESPRRRKMFSKLEKFRPNFVRILWMVTTNVSQTWN